MLIKGFIQYLKTDQPNIWKLLCFAANDGLVVIDEENDAITASNRLLWTYPGLHEVLVRIVNGWTEDSLTTLSKLPELVDRIQTNS